MLFGGLFVCVCLIVLLLACLLAYVFACVFDSVVGWVGWVGWLCGCVICWLVGWLVLCVLLVCVCLFACVDLFGNVFDCWFVSLFDCCGVLFGCLRVRFVRCAFVCVLVSLSNCSLVRLCACLFGLFVGWLVGSFVGFSVCCSRVCASARLSVRVFARVFVCLCAIGNNIVLFGCSFVCSLV